MDCVLALFQFFDELNPIVNPQSSVRTGVMFNVYSTPEFVILPPFISIPSRPFSKAIDWFTISLDDFIITQLNKGASTGIDTLSTYLYSSLRKASGLRAFWLPAFSIIIVIVVAAVLLINLRSYKKEGRKKEKINEKNR